MPGPVPQCPGRKASIALETEQDLRRAQKDEAQAKALMEEVAGLKDAIQQGESEQRALEAMLREALARGKRVTRAMAAELLRDAAER